PSSASTARSAWTAASRDASRVGLLRSARATASSTASPRTRFVAPLDAGAAAEGAPCTTPGAVLAAAGGAPCAAAGAVLAAAGAGAVGALCACATVGPATSRATRGTQERRRSFMAKGFDGIEPRGLVRREVAEGDTDERGEGEGEQQHVRQEHERQR